MEVPKPVKKVKVKKKKIKTERQKAIDALDGLWSEAVKKRDKKCMYCGSTFRLAAHHIFSRSSKNTRWDLENGITLCSGHHQFLAHKHPEKFKKWLIENWTASEKYETLYMRSNTRAGKQDLRLIGVILKSYL